MRVLLVVHGFPPGAYGGTELYTYALAQALRAAGDEVFVLTRDADPQRPEHELRRETVDGLQVARINNTFRDARRFADTYRDATIRRLAARFVDEVRPDVAHVHHLTCLSVDLLEELALRGVPTVVTLNDYWMICHRGQLLGRDLERCSGPGEAGCARCLGPEAGDAATHAAARLLRGTTAAMPRLGGLLRRGLGAVAGHRPGGWEAASRAATLERAAFMRHQLAFADVILAPSRTLRDRFVAFGIPAERLTLQEQGIPLAPFRGLPPRVSPEAEGATRRGPLRLGFLGSLMVSKAPHLLLAAFARLRPGEATLRVLGQPVPYHGDDSYRDQLGPLLQQPGVEHAGPVPHAEVPAALAALDVLVVPSVWIENAPFVIRESFAAGVPVVTADLGGMAEMVADGQSGLRFRPGDAQDLHRCLRRLLDEPELLPRLRAGIPAMKDIGEDAAWTREIYARRIAARTAGPAASARGAAAEASPQPRLAAVVLHYRTPDDTLLAVRSLLASRRPVDEVVVVDNGSGDGSAALLRAQLPEATLLETGANLGFSAGCNVGIRHALERGAQRVLLLNSDAVLPPDALGRLETALTAPGVGIAGPLLLSRTRPDLVASAGMRWSPRSGRMRHLLAGAPLDGSLADSAPVEVDGVSGCAMLLSAELLRRVGPLADSYFFSFEDLELCLRARDAGFATVCVPAARAYHEGGQSIGASSPARLYYGTRNHLLLAARTGDVTPLRTGAVLLWNVAHALLTAGVPRPAALAAVLAGARDHFRGRYGPRS